jgi:hypothetical protein
MANEETDYSGVRLMLWHGATGISSLHVENDRCKSNPCPSEDVHGTQCIFSGYVMQKVTDE